MKYFIILFYLLSTLPAGAALTDVDKTQIFSKNILPNGGFELGKSGWTPNDTADFAVTTTTPMVGLAHATWDADASTDTLAYAAFPIQAGYFGRNGVASCLFTTASGTATVEIQATDGSNVLSEASITSSTSPTRTSTNFIFPSSGSIQLRLYANADEPSIAIDDCYLGPAEGYNVSSVSQATLHGTASHAGTASCQWAGTSATMAAFSADADCPTPTLTVNALAPSTKVPGIRFTNLPPGRYVVDAVAALEGGTSTECSFAISDGSTTSGATYAVGNATTDGPLQAEFNYTAAQSDITFQIYQDRLSGANSCLVTNTTEFVLKFRVTRFPTSSEQAYTPDLQAMSWSGYHDSTCSWARTNTAYGDPTADATCALVERTNQNFGTVSTTGSVLPGITFTPKKAGRYFVCASALWQTGALAQGNLRLLDNASNVIDVSSSTITTGGYLDTAKLCGIISVTSTAAQTLKIQTASNTSSLTIAASLYSVSAIEWSLVSIDQSIPAPVLTNMVTTPSSGGIRICSGYIANAGTPSVTRSDGDCLTNPVDNGTGDTTLTFATGTFSATPNCTCSGVVSAGQSVVCAIDSTTATSSTTVRVQTTTVVPADFDAPFHLTCIGAR